MNLDRLKFAWARGARIEVVRSGSWDTLLPARYLADFSGQNGEVRIHPDDAHLEYGPASTAIHTAVLMSNYTEFWLMAKGGIVHCLAHGDDEFDEADDNEMCFFALFFAEYLADQGL